MLKPKSKIASLTLLFAGRVPRPAPDVSDLGSAFEEDGLVFELSASLTPSKSDGFFGGFSSTSRFAVGTRRSLVWALSVAG